ncbi:hypothetical protein MTO98_33060 [Mucilaginibacter sp. SMC90]|uniref:hypothetical protein n=1 Tax=Mucilaginibacter sp. SMC90 TaxID=2929803 RepID=UPI001FB26AFE|nr:hypothetical protein [Mucilaginibacter sp. SMC90]UOE49226.1 hypothetical protein MTO98_33060 [Mucilaginibacter sp. SMC90]
MKKLFVICIMSSVIVFFELSFKSEPPKANYPVLPKDSVGSVKAFMSVYKVLMSARCMNCHPSGDSPLQGDDSHIHTMNVKRGADGRGLYAVRCSNCHQSENTEGLHMPPGNPKWGLPPAHMRMVFQGRTPRQLALQLLDPKQNGGRTKADLINHMANDELVGWAWHPGKGRTLPPMSRAALTAQVKLWIAKGAYAPSAKTK